MRISSDKGKDECEQLRVPHKYYGSVVTNPRVGDRGSTTIEPVMFLFLVAKGLSDSVITNLLEYRTCKVQLALPDGNCTEPISQAMEDLVQPTTANVIMVRSMVEAFLPSCLAVLIGPWSDVNGRKPFLIIALAGIALTYMCWGCLALLPWTYPWGFLLASVPVSLSGGSCAVYLLIFCYISDVTDEHTRPFRLSLLTLAIFTSSIFGIACAPLLVAVQHSLNPYPLLFFLSSFLLLLTCLYTHLYIRESVDVRSNRETRLFLFRHVKDLALACFQRRRGHARTMILLILLTLTFNVFVVEGESAVIYLSAREMFSWQLVDFTVYSCFGCICNGFGALLGVWLLSSVFGLSNMVATTVVVATRTLRSGVMALSTSGWYFYSSTLMSSLATAYGPLCRTELSRLAPRRDIGKIFALTAFLESITPMAAAPLYTYVYKDTFLESPGMVYWLSSVLFTATVFMLLAVVALQRRVHGVFYVDNHQDPETEIFLD